MSGWLIFLKCFRLNDHFSLHVHYCQLQSLIFHNNVMKTATAVESFASSRDVGKIFFQWGLIVFFPGVVKDIFPGGPKVVKFHFIHSKIRKQPFWKKWIEKCRISNFREPKPPDSPSYAHGFVTHKETSLQNSLESRMGVSGCFVFRIRLMENVPKKVCC